MFDYQFGLSGSFKTDFAVLVDGKAGIEYCVRNLIAELVWVTFSN
jgi:hypothetical protein